jgi:methylisocitrate lyase
VRREPGHTLSTCTSSTDHLLTPLVSARVGRSGAAALYVSGGGVSAFSYGLPDLGIITLDNVVEDVKRITAATRLPLLVDIDTGFGSAFNIARTVSEQKDCVSCSCRVTPSHTLIAWRPPFSSLQVRELERAGAGGAQMEDQESAKRCGHRPNKQLVSLEEMVDRIKAAVAGRTDPEFVIMARTDALANEGLEKAIERAKAYIEAGADMLFPEACNTLEHYRAFQTALSTPNYHKDVPILANITEYGQVGRTAAGEKLQGRQHPQSHLMPPLMLRNC